MKSRIIVIVGPTASGKSALAVKIAKKVNGEIISADSRQVYRGLNLASGKITKREMQGVRHYCLDLVSPSKNFTADDYKKCFWDAVRKIEKCGKIPIVAGGTGFYIDVALGRMATAAVPPNAALRRRLTKKSAEELLRMLKRRDPRRATDIARKGEQKNKFRLIRAIEISFGSNLKSYPHHRFNLWEKIDKKSLESREVIHTIGSTYGSLNAEDYDIRWIGISHAGEALRKKIRERLRGRIRHGMIAEIKKLRRGGVSWKRLEELGLEPRWIARYLQGKITKEQMLYHLENAIWRYSKRQMTWFGRNKEIQWITSADIPVITKHFS